MASARFVAWDRLGRPLEPAQPVREIVERLKVAFPHAAAANLFGWRANEAHYTADPPQDHTPFSADGWPVPDPQWVVCATDVMHRTDLGVDCNVLFPYWLAEARAGRTPWVKYLIYQATIYDVRHGWRPQANSGHFDHIHISTRTDHINTHLGAWSLVPGGDDMDLDTKIPWFSVKQRDRMIARGQPADGVTLRTLVYGFEASLDLADVHKQLDALTKRVDGIVVSGDPGHTHAVSATSGPAQPAAGVLNG